MNRSVEGLHSERPVRVAAPGVCAELLIEMGGIEPGLCGTSPFQRWDAPDCQGCISGKAEVTGQ